jgi:hypothetical protein
LSNQNTGSPEILKAELHFGEERFLLLEKVHGESGVIPAMTLASQHSLEKLCIIWQAFWQLSACYRLYIQDILALHVPSHGFLLPHLQKADARRAFQEIHSLPLLKY